MSKFEELVEKIKNRKLYIVNDLKKQESAKKILNYIGDSGLSWSASDNFYFYNERGSFDCSDCVYYIEGISEYIRISELVSLKKVSELLEIIESSKSNSKIIVSGNPLEIKRIDYKGYVKEECDKSSRRFKLAYFSDTDIEFEEFSLFEILFPEHNPNFKTHECEDGGTDEILDMQIGDIINTKTIGDKEYNQITVLRIS